MSTYAIGDTQGCYQTLRLLLEKIQYQPDKDFLWFCGDLINRGPESLNTLTFIKSLVESGEALTVLGNHDLHLLAVAEAIEPPREEDTFQDILNSPKKIELIDWIRQQALCHYDKNLNFFMVHAGLIPQWSVADALQFSNEVTEVLRDDKLYRDFLKNMYGNEPKQWSDDLTGFSRLRFITNVCTRLRFCTEDGVLNLKNKGILGSQTDKSIPWFTVENRKTKHDRIIFGHWAALYPNWNTIKTANLFPIDSGCVWGHGMTALCLETQQYFWVSG